MKKRKMVILLALVGAIVLLSLKTSDGAREPKSITMSSHEEFVPEWVMVPAKIALRTEMGFMHEGSPPWDMGNCFHVPSHAQARPSRGYLVFNMNAENFEVFVRESGMAEVKVLRVSEDVCLIADPRIPNAWLDAKGVGEGLSDFARLIYKNHPQYFRQP